MKKLTLLLGVAALLSAPFNLHAGKHTWTGGHLFGFWSIPANWESNNPPVAGESGPMELVFPADAIRRGATNNIPNLTIDAMSFAGAAYTIAATADGSNTVINTSMGNPWWNISASGTGHRFASSFSPALDGTLEVYVAANANIEISSRLSSVTPNSGLSKAGSGTLFLSPFQANTFDGTTVVRQGTLQLEGGFFFGGFNPVITVPGNLIVGSSNPVVAAQCIAAQANQIADNAAVTVHDGSDLIFDNVNDAIGALTLVGGSVDTGTGKLTLNGDVKGITPASLNHAGYIYGNLDLGMLSRTFDTMDNGADLNVYANISGGNFGNTYAGVTKNGPGDLMLYGANTYDGYTFVQQGDLWAMHSHALGSTNRPTSVASNAELLLNGTVSGPIIEGEGLSLYQNARLSVWKESEWNGPITLAGQAIIVNQTSNANLTIRGNIDGPGGLTKSGFAEVILNGSENNTYAGSTLVNNGLLTLAQGSFFSNRVAIPGPLTIGGAGYEATVMVAKSESIAGGPVTVNADGKLLFGTLVSETLGPLAINTGEVDTGLSGVLHLLGNVMSTNVGSVGRIKGRLNLGNSPHTFHVAGMTLDIDAEISGGANGSLIKSGPYTLALGASNSYAGVTLIQTGVVIMANSHSLGATNGGTTLSNGASLQINASGTGSLHVNGEALFLNGPGYVSNQAVSSSGTNSWSGPMTLNADSGVSVETNGQFTISGNISGPGGFEKSGPGRLVLSGTGLSGGNSYAGRTEFSGSGEVVLMKTEVAFPFSNVAVPGDLTVWSGNVRVMNDAQFAHAGNVFIRQDGTIICEPGTSNWIGSLAGPGTLDFRPGARLYTGVNNSNTLFNGTLQGGLVTDTNLIKYGNGTFTLSCVNHLAGRIRVNGGKLWVNNTQPGSRFDAMTPGTLGGTGSVGTVTMRGGYLAPGASTGKLKADSFVVAGSHALHIDLNGPALPTHDQFEVGNAPDFSSTQLGTAFGNNYNPTNGQEFLIVRNNTALPTVPFMAMAEGTIFNVDATHLVKITYLGGDGNDVVLKVMPQPGKFGGVSFNGGDRMTLNGSGTPGAGYNIQANTNLNNINGWISIGTAIADEDGLLEFVAGDVTTHPIRFFRFSLP